MQHSKYPKGSSAEEVKELAGLSSRFQGLCWVTTDGEPENQEHVFYHELVHLILSHMYEKKLTKDEKFVDGLAGLIHQFMKTRKY